MVLARIELLNPISKRVIREHEFTSISLMNDYLAFVGGTRLHDYRIIGIEKVTVQRDAGYLPIAV